MPAPTTRAGVSATSQVESLVGRAQLGAVALLGVKATLRVRMLEDGLRQPGSISKTADAVKEQA